MTVAKLSSNGPMNVGKRHLVDTAVTTVEVLERWRVRRVLTFARRSVPRIVASQPDRSR